MDDPQLIVLDYWFTNNQSLMLNANLFPYKVKNLHKMPLNISTVPNFPPYIIIEKNVHVYPNSNPKTITDGLEIQILREYGNRNNITLNFTIDPRGWGNVFANRTGNGVYGNVMENKFNVGIGGIILWAEAGKYIEYAYAVFEGRIICLVPSPRIKDKFLLALFPFTFSLWMGIICSIIILTMSLNYLSHSVIFMNKTWNEIDNQEVFYNCSREILNKVLNGFSKSLFTIFYLTLLQPLSQNLLRKSMLTHRIIFTLCFLQALLISTAYISGLSAILALPQYEKAIRTRQDLIDSKMEWGANDNNWVIFILNTNDSKINDLLKTFKVYDTEILRNLPLQTFGYIIGELSDGSFIMPDYVPLNKIETLQLMDEEIFHSDVHAVFRKSSPFILDYNKIVGRFRESGLIYRLKEQMTFKHLNSSMQLQLQKRRNTNIRQNRNPIQFSIYDLESIFLLWSLGIICSCIIFGIEKYNYIA